MIVHGIDLCRHEADIVHIFNRLAEPPRIFVKSNYRQFHKHALRSRDSFSAPFNHLALEALSVDFNEDVSLAFCRNLIESRRRYALNSIGDDPPWNSWASSLRLRVELNFEFAEILILS